MKKEESYRDYMMFCFGINIGLRITDILDLKVKDVRNKSRIYMKETKTKKEKIFPINDELSREIEFYIKGMADDSWLFPSRRNPKNPVDRVRVYRIFNKVARRLGIEERIGTHTLRKTFGYHYYKRTKDIAMLQDLFNHSSQKVTLDYIGINQDMIDDAYMGFYL